MPLNCGSPCLGTAVKASEIADLAYIEGVDSLGCWRFEVSEHLVCRVFAGLLPNGNAVPGTTLVVGADCQTYGIAPETPNAAIDTPSVDITLSGALNRTIQADVKRSATAGNQIVENADGLFVAPFSLCPFVALVPDSVSPLVFGTTRVIGKDCQAYTIEETVLVGNDTQSVNLTASGLFGHTLQADVILDPSANNLATIGAPGLLVQETTFVPTTNSTIQSTVGGIHGHSPIYAVRVSATAGNQVSVNADGLFVAAGAGETPLTANDSTTLDFTTSGVANHTLTGSVKISPNGANALTDAGNGLYVATGSYNLCVGLGALATGAPGVSGVGIYVGADCLQHTLPVEQPWNGLVANAGIGIAAGGTAGHSPTFALIISPTAGNIATINATGLYVPTPLPTTACSVGVLVQANTTTILELAGLDGFGCMTSETICDFFGRVPSIPQAVNGYRIPGIQTLDGCLTSLPPTFNVIDDFGTAGTISLGLASPQGRLRVHETLGGGLGVVGTNDPTNGSYAFAIQITPCNGWNTLLTTVSAATITSYVGLDAGGCLAQFVAPAITPETTFAATSGNAALVITPGGTAGHAPLFAVTLSAATENIITIDGAGLYARKPNTFGSQYAVGAQANDGAAITALNALVGMVGGEHATVVVGGVYEVFFYNGTTWIRAY